MTFEAGINELSKKLRDAPTSAELLKSTGSNGQLSLLLILAHRAGNFDEIADNNVFDGVNGVHEDAI